MKVIFTHGGPNPYNPKAEALITLAIGSNEKFVVTYGEEVSEELNYIAAAYELGECLMHRLACEGLLED